MLIFIGIYTADVVERGHYPQGIFDLFGNSQRLQVQFQRFGFVALVKNTAPWLLSILATPFLSPISW